MDDLDLTFVKVAVQEFIKEIQGEKNQQTLADMLGLSQSAISDYIKAKRTPSLERLHIMAEYANIKPWHLLARLYGEDYTDMVTDTETELRRAPLAEKVRLLKILAEAIDADIGDRNGEKTVEAPGKTRK